MGDLPFYAGGAIRRIRRSLPGTAPDGGLTQHELAALLGVRNGFTISRWERDEASPQPRYVRQLEKIERRGKKLAQERDEEQKRAAAQASPFAGRSK